MTRQALPIGCERLYAVLNLESIHLSYAFPGEIDYIESWRNPSHKRKSICELSESLQVRCSFFAPHAAAALFVVIGSGGTRPRYVFQDLLG